MAEAEYRYVELARDTLPNLCFRGRLLADVSTADGVKARWSEFRIWRIENRDEWVVERVGLSRMPTEVDRRAAVHCQRPGEVVMALVKTDDRHGFANRYLPDAAWNVLCDAAEADPLLDEVLNAETIR